MNKKGAKDADKLGEMAAVFPVGVSVHRAEDGGYWVEAPQLGGCFAEGPTAGKALYTFKLVPH